MKVITDLDESLRRQILQQILGIAFTASAGGQNYSIQTGRPGDGHRRPNRGCIGGMGHRLDHAGGAQNRNTADNTQTCIESFAGQYFALRNKNLDPHPQPSRLRSDHLTRCATDHFLRPRINGRLAGRNIQTGFGYGPDTLSACHDDPATFSGQL